MQRLFVWLVVAMIVLSPLAGCGPSLSEKQLGKIEYQVPTFPKKKSEQKAPKEAAVPATDQSTEGVAPGGVEESPK